MAVPPARTRPADRGSRARGRRRAEAPPTVRRYYVGIAVCVREGEGGAGRGGAGGSPFFALLVVPVNKTLLLETLGDLRP